MSQTKDYELKGKQVLLQESHHYIYSNKVKKKQGNHETKHPKSSRIWNIYYNTNIHIWLERWYFESFKHPLEINIKFIYSIII